MQLVNTDDYDVDSDVVVAPVPIRDAPSRYQVEPPIQLQSETTKKVTASAVGWTPPRVALVAALSVLIITSLTIAGVSLQSYAREKNRTSAPTLAPTTAAPTTPVPTLAPTTATPTLAPTDGPTLAPTFHPTVEDIFVPVNPTPRNAPRSYFNYNNGDNRYGPRNWRNINMDGTYFEEFGINGFGPWQGHMEDHVADTTVNRCGISGKQSPIDLYQTRGEESECTATHQIRTRVSIYTNAMLG